MRAAASLTMVMLAVAVACVYAPDYSRYTPCGEGGRCEVGYLCYAEENLCLPACGEQAAELCVGADGGFDGGDDAGAEHDAGEDAGEDVDAGDDGGSPEDGGTVVLLNTTLPAAVEGDPYNHIFDADGGVPPYAFFADALPEGLALDGGALTGTPLDAGTSTFSIEVRDSLDDGDSAQVSLFVARRMRVASGGEEATGTSPITNADVGQPYSEQLLVTGVNPSQVSWTRTGNLPSGLSMSASGLISGTANGSGTHTFEVTATSAEMPEQVRQRSLSIELVNLGVTLHILTRTLPAGRVGEAYGYTLAAGGGTGAKTWSHTGPLPPGITRSGNQLTGTPTQAGDWTFTVEVGDTTLGKVTRQLTLHVDP